MRLKTILTMIGVILAVLSTRAQAPTLSKKGEPLTAPEKGLSVSEIDQVILRPTVSGTAYGVTSKVVVYLLLKDGSIYSRPSASPHDLDIRKSRTLQANKWGKWSTASGNKLEVNFKSSQQWEKYYRAVKARTAEKIENVFKTVGSFRGSRVGDFNTLVLTKEGTFTWRYFYRVDGTHKPHKKDKETSGKYLIKDYTLELRYNNGATDRFLFAKHPNGKGLIIGSQSFFEFEHPLLK